MTRTDLDFYRGRRVLVTGHTGFKGAWLCRVLVQAGAVLTGYGLGAPTNPSLFALAGLEGNMTSVMGDVRDFGLLDRTFQETRPEIVFHLAAQPIVREGYRNPVGTYGTNVMGTVNVLECVRRSETVRSIVNVTTDKVYQNREWIWGYREVDPLDGFDPYSNSKSCSELVTHSYANSFFADGRVAVSTVRAGNVIGGGDFAPDRIIPDCVRSVLAGEPVTVRNPDSIRPYQHVLEPLTVYLMIAARQYEDGGRAGWYNVGPDEGDCVATGRLVELFCDAWGAGARWRVRGDHGPHEAGLLKLDCSKLKSAFGWSPQWNIQEAVEKVCEWTRQWAGGGDIPAVMDRQISEYWERIK